MSDRVARPLAVGINLNGPYSVLVRRSIGRMPGQMLDPLTYELDLLAEDLRQVDRHGSLSPGTPALLCGLSESCKGDGDEERRWTVTPLRLCTLMSVQRSSGTLTLLLRAEETLSPRLGGCQSVGEEVWRAFARSETDVQETLSIRGLSLRHPYLVAPLEKIDVLNPLIDELFGSANPRCCSSRGEVRSLQHRLRQLRQLRYEVDSADLDDADRWRDLVRELENQEASGSANTDAQGDDRSADSNGNRRAEYIRLVRVVERYPCLSYGLDRAFQERTLPAVASGHIRLRRRRIYELQLRSRASGWRPGMPAGRLAVNVPRPLGDLDEDDSPLFAGTQQSWVRFRAADAVARGYISVESVVDERPCGTSLDIPVEIKGLATAGHLAGLGFIFCGFLLTVWASLPDQLSGIREAAGVVLVAIGAAFLARREAGT